MKLRINTRTIQLSFLLLFCVEFGIERATAAPAAAPGQESARTLHPGSTVRAALAAGEIHRYVLHAGTGQYVRVTVDAGVMNLQVRLLEAEKETLRKLIGDEYYGQESVSIHTPTAAKIMLELSRLSEDAVASSYALHIDASRPATPEDALRVHSERLFAAADALIEDNTLDAFPPADALLTEALSGFRAVGARRQEALTLIALGAVRMRQVDRQGALRAHQQALSIFRAEHDRSGEASTLIRISNVFHNLGDWEQALAHLRLALPMLEQLGRVNVLAVALYYAGLHAQNLGDWQEAMAYFRRALQHPNMKAKYHSIRGLGDLMIDLGEIEKAHVFYDQALTLIRKNGDRSAEADALSTKAYAHEIQQEWDRALDVYGQALALTREIGYRWREASTLRGIGTVHRSQGDPARALTYFRQGVPIAQAVVHPGAEALLLADMGLAHLDLGSFADARASLERALAIFRSLGERLKEARTLAAIARVDVARGDLETALSYAERATTLANSLRNRVSRQDLRASFFSTVRSIHEAHIDVLMQLHGKQPDAGYHRTALAASERDRARSLLETLATSHTDLYARVPPALLARIRELERTLDNKGWYHYQEQTAPPTTSALPASDPVSDQELDNLIDTYRDLLTALREASPRYAALTQPTTLDLQALQRQLLDDSTQVLHFSLGKERSYLWLVSREAIHTATLPPRCEIEAVARRLHTLLAQSHWRGAEAQTELVASKLSALLLAPIEDQLRKKRLLVVADGALSYIPFAMLPAPGDATRAPLLLDHEVVSVPSLSVLDHLRSARPRWGSQNQRIAVVADPVFTAQDARTRSTTVALAAAQTAASPVADAPPSRLTDLERSANDLGVARFERLPFSRREAASIARLAPAEGSLVALDFDADLSTVTSGKLRDYSIVHFATHTMLNSKHPELSGLVLSLVDEGGQPQDGFLRAHRIANLDLSADLVVLSGCQTALGKEVRGEGLMGLTRAFMHAGASRVIVSLWKVSDRATAALMQRFYRKMLQDNAHPAAALRAAQLELRADPRWQAPYYWAGFQLQGDWQ